MNRYETYVSLETSKLLKQAGFKWFIDSAYRDGELVYKTDGLQDNFNAKSYEVNTPYEFFSAPTLAVAQRWLREVKDKQVYVISYRNNNSDKTAGYCFKVYEFSQGWEFNYSTYEEALEAGIQKCLTILLEK